MYRKWLVLGLAVGLALGGIAGAPQGQPPTEIKLVGFSGDTPVVQDLLAFLEQQGLLPPGVKVVWEPEPTDMRQRVLNDLAAGGAALADIYYIDSFWAGEAAATGKLLALNDLIAASEELGPDLRQHWLEALVDAFEFGGQIYAIAKDFNSLALWYNKDVFVGAGVAFPANDDSWIDFLAKAAQVQRVVPEGTAALSWNPDAVRFLPFAFANGMPFLTEQGCAPFDRPEAIEAARFYALPILGGFAKTSTDVGAGWPGAAFTAEKGFIVNEGGWMLGPIQNENPTLDFGVAFLPLAPTGQRANYLFTVGYGIPAESPRRELAFRVVEALVSREANLFVLERLAIPPRKALLEDPESPLANPQNAFQAAARVIFEATGQPGTRPFTFGEVGGPAYLDPLNAALTKIFNGEASVAEAMREAAVQLNRSLVDKGLVAPGVCPGT